MNKAQALAYYRLHVLPVVIACFERDGRIDGPARREAWNNFTDGLCKGGQISQHQYETWVGPHV
jgi:hypothetical protein